MANRKRPRPPANFERTNKAERLRRDCLVEALLIEGRDRRDIRYRLAADHELDLPTRTLDACIKRVRDRWSTEAKEGAAHRREELSRLIRREAAAMLATLHGEDGPAPTWSNWIKALELLAKVEGVLNGQPNDDADAEPDAEDLEELTDEELEAVVSIQKKLGRTE